MKVAFLNICHSDAEMVGRVTKRLTANENFGMFIHVDAKKDIEPFIQVTKECKNVAFTDKRYKVYWGGYNAIKATIELLKCALASEKHYDYFMILQNLDYPIKSNSYIEKFFEKNDGTEFLRGCPIAGSREDEFSRKYKKYYYRDTSFANKGRKDIFKLMNGAYNKAMSIKTRKSDGTVKDFDGTYNMYYGAAQWAVTRECAEYIIKFNAEHKEFNKRMSRVQFPDELYFHTIVHNSEFKEKCVLFNEPEKLWLVNWRNLHYFEFPKEVTVLDESYFEKLMSIEELFCRKVVTGYSDRLLEMIDKQLKEN